MRHLVESFLDVQEYTNDITMISVVQPIMDFLCASNKGTICASPF